MVFPNEPTLACLPGASARRLSFRRKRREGSRRCRADSRVVHPRAQQISPGYFTGMNTNGGPSWTSPARERSMGNRFPITACPRGLVSPCPYDREVGLPLHPQARRLTDFRAEFYLSWGCPKIAPPSTEPVEACRPTHPTSMSAHRPRKPLSGISQPPHFHPPSALPRAPPSPQLRFGHAGCARSSRNRDDDGNGPAGNGTIPPGNHEDSPTRPSVRACLASMTLRPRGPPSLSGVLVGTPFRDTELPRTSRR